MQESELAYLDLYRRSNTAAVRVSPEVRPTEPIPAYNLVDFDTKRALSRLYALSLLLKGDDAAEVAYELFAKDQPVDCKLSRKDFDALVAVYKQFSPDKIAALRVSCFLTTSNAAKSMLRDREFAPPEDSEEFLTWVVKCQPDGRLPLDLLSIANGMSPDVKNCLISLYPKDAHFR